MSTKIREFMTAEPHTINSHQSLKFATEKMREFGVRHLPVMERGRLVGILSDRDIKFIESFEKLDPEELTVEDAFTEGAFKVSPDASIHDVCAEMVENKYGSALVEEDQKLVGIFTWIDALKYIAAQK